jgi:hypothetical protein
MAKGQTVPARVKEDSINAIRRIFQDVNKDRTLRDVYLSGDDFLDHAADNGADLHGYYEKDSLRKMVFEIGLSYGMLRHEYYYNTSGQVVFVYDTEKSYPTTDSGIDNSRLDLNFEGRYYFYSKGILDTKVKGELRFHKKVTPAYIAGLLKDGASYARILHKHLKK